MRATLRATALSDAEHALGSEVRAFVAAELGDRPRRALGMAAEHDRDFSRRLGARGWVGMGIPVEYGGPGRTHVERFVVTEELLAAQAPVGAHWVADRQTAPSLLRFGTEEQKRRFLPAIARGECCFAIGMSEPDAGSDLAAVRTRALPVPGGWSVTGTKVWTSGAHLSDWFVVLCRTDDAGDDRHAGLSQLIVDLHAPGVRASRIETLDGGREFCEVVLDGVLVPETMVLGRPGEGWQQVTAELAFERYGPERWLSVLGVLRAWIGELSSRPDAATEPAVGRIVARMRVIRGLSLAVARLLDAGERPAVEAAMVKDLATTFEQDMVETLRGLAATEADPGGDHARALLAHAVLSAPQFTIRGGTTEILRTIIARGLRG